jgi:hypothetical protein
MYLTAIGQLGYQISERIRADTKPRTGFGQEKPTNRSKQTGISFLARSAKYSRYQAEL